MCGKGKCAGCNFAVSHFMKVFLTGFMGSGKSFYAAKLAELLSFPCIELDDEIEKEEGMTINQIFDQKGESYFRQREAEQLRKCMSTTSFVMACGGGASCYYDNMKLMNKNGVTVWINASEDVMVKRLLPEIHKRPLLKDMDERSVAMFVKDKLQERVTYYQQADIIVSADEFDLDSLRNNIQMMHQLKFGNHE